MNNLLCVIFSDDNDDSDNDVFLTPQSQPKASEPEFITPVSTPKASQKKVEPEITTTTLAPKTLQQDLSKPQLTTPVQPKRSTRMKPPEKFTPSDYQNVPKRKESVKPKKLIIDQKATISSQMQKLADLKRIQIENYGTNFRQFPKAFFGKPDRGITIFHNQTGKLCWFNGISQVIGEQMRRIDAKAPLYDPKSLFSGAYDNKLPLLYSHLIFGCNMKKVYPEQIVRDIAVKYLGVEKDEVDKFVTTSFEAVTWYDKIADMISTPLDHKDTSKGLKYPEMQFFDFMVFTIRLTTVCQDCLTTWHEDQPQTMFSFDVVDGWKVRDHMHNRLDTSVLRQYCCFNCHGHTKDFQDGNCTTYEKDPKTNKFLRDKHNMKIPIPPPKHPLHSTYSVVGNPEFITVHLRRKYHDEFGREKYNDSHIPIDDGFTINGIMYKPIAILSHSEKLDHFWCYVNREDKNGKDLWHWISDSNVPKVADEQTAGGPTNIVMVVYQKMKPDEAEPKRRRNIRMANKLRKKNIETLED